MEPPIDADARRDKRKNEKIRILTGFALLGVHRLEAPTFGRFYRRLPKKRVSALSSSFCRLFDIDGGFEDNTGTDAWAEQAQEDDLEAREGTGTAGRGRWRNARGCGSRNHD